MEFEVNKSGGKLVLRDIAGIFKYIDRLSKTLDAFYCTGKSLTVNVSLGTFELRLALDVRKKRLRKRVLPIPIFNSVSVQLTAASTMLVLDKAIFFDEQKGIILSVELIPDAVESVILDIQCPLEYQRFMRTYVTRYVTTDSLGPVTKYNMAAQIKDPDDLKKKLTSYRIEDVDLSFGVHVEQNIKDIIPNSFMNDLKLGQDLLRETDRNKKLRLASLHRGRARSNPFSGHEEELIEEIDNLLKPRNFENFLDMKGQFSYIDCSPSGSFFKMPNFVLPSVMKITSRTILTYEEPAKKGELQFKRRDFEDSIENLFPKRMRKTKRRKR